MQALTLDSISQNMIDFHYFYLTTIDCVKLTQHSHAYSDFKSRPFFGFDRR
jgi:hypothetical protein